MERQLGTPPDVGGTRGTQSAVGGIDLRLRCERLACPVGSRQRTAEGLDLLWRCHYYNYCYYVTTVFFKTIPVGDFTLSSQSSNEVS